MKSATHSWFGRGAWNCRLTRSGGHGVALSLIVVRHRLAAHGATQADLPHQPLDRAARDSDALRGGAAARPCARRRPAKFSSHTRWISAASRVAPRPRRQALRRIGPLRRVLVVRRRGDRQHLADRLDPVVGAVFVDERDHHFGRRSSSAWAKYADALRRISFAWRSSRFSRSSSLSRSRSSLVRPGRCPGHARPAAPSCAASRRVQPIFAAIETIAAHCEACSPPCSNTIRTARSRTSGENRFVSSSSWLHPLKSWSLRETRGGSGRHP